MLRWSDFVFWGVVVFVVIVTGTSIYNVWGKDEPYGPNNHTKCREAAEVLGFVGGKLGGINGSNVKCIAYDPGLGTTVYVKEFRRGKEATE